MYKVVLVDDEEIIQEGLRRVVDWALYDCEVVATACDAISGTETICRHYPDILFTDIKMPGEDGLTMLAGLEEALAHMKAVLDRMTTKGEEGAAKEADEDPNSFVVRRARAYVMEHYAEHLSLQEVADQCYVSQWHLSKLLNKHLGQSFYDLLNAVRIREAQKRMADPALRISEVAELVGYADTAHFSRVLKKWKGFQPESGAIDTVVRMARFCKIALLFFELSWYNVGKHYAARISGR